MHQLDIFLDSHEVTLANEAIAALSALDSERAARAIDCLRAAAPERSDLPCLDKLHDFLSLFQSADFAALDADAVEVVVEVFRDRVVPCARVLGDAGKGFLTFFWLRLARAASAPFDPERPQLHAAELFLRAEAYEAAEEAASGVVSQPTHRAVLRWQAIARYRRAGRRAALSKIFVLAWHAPDAFADLLAELDDRQLAKEWVAFEADVEDLDASWFPVWHLLRQPASAAAVEVDLADALAQQAAGAATESIPALHAYRLLARILDLEKGGHSAKLVALRARLQAIDAGFFTAYMRSRDVRYR